jgi:hypothetical protein
MAAPLGFKTFVTGDVLTAADTNGYLMQGIWTFANATARDAAVTAPVEGNTCYLKDTDVIQVYSGSAWVTKSGSSPLTTKGDVYTYSTTDARLAVGANDTVLTADSTALTGLKWATPSSGMTLLSTTTLSGASTNITGISGSYTNLLVLVFNVTSNTSSGQLQVQANSVSTCGSWVGQERAVTAVTNSVGNGQSFLFSNNFGYTNTGGANGWSMLINNYASTTQTYKPFTSSGVYTNTTPVLVSTNVGGTMTVGASTAITSLLFDISGDFNGGTVLIYGVK